jgi:hypothetical protein
MAITDPEILETTASLLVRKSPRLDVLEGRVVYIKLVHIIDAESIKSQMSKAFLLTNLQDSYRSDKKMLDKNR